LTNSWEHQPRPHTKRQKRAGIVRKLGWGALGDDEWGLPAVQSHAVAAFVLDGGRCGVIAAAVPCRPVAPATM